MKNYDEESKFTRHAIERTTERCRKSKHAAERFLSLAMTRGTTGTDLPDWERLYLKSRSEETGHNALCYAGYCLIIGQNDRVVTMYSLPTWFGKHARRPSKKNEERIITRGGNLSRYYDSKNDMWVA